MSPVDVTLREFCGSFAGLRRLLPDGHTKDSDLGVDNLAPKHVVRVRISRGEPFSRGYVGYGEPFVQICGL